MKKAILIVLAFCVISIGLTWFWNEWARESYGQFLRAVAPSIYELIGFEHARVGALRERYINFVPFVSLVLVTPGLTLPRRTIGLGLFDFSHSFREMQRFSVIGQGVAMLSASSLGYDWASPWAGKCCRLDQKEASKPPEKAVGDRVPGRLR